MLTRTIKVSCLSRFLLLLLPVWQILIRPNPDTLICTPANFCTVTQKWLRLILYRDTALVPSGQFLHRDSKVVPWQFVPRPLTNKIILVPGRQKHAPYLSCHRDSKVAKVPGYVAGWRRQVTQPPFIAGPLGVHCPLFLSWVLARSLDESLN